MRRLSLSLLLVVVLAIAGTGWAIDRLFRYLEPPRSEALGPQREWAMGLAMALDRAADPASELREWDMIEGVELDVLAAEELPLPAELQQALKSPAGLNLQSDIGYGLYFLLPRSGSVLSLRWPSHIAHTSWLRLTLTILFYSGVVVLILVWLSPLVRRLQRLADAARRFGEGHLEHRIATHAGSQIHDIESEFNRMANRIQELVSDNKLLSSAVSHDLRTPLARLRFGVDALAETANSDVQTGYLKRLGQDVSEMEGLVDVLLSYARLDQHLHELPLHRIDIEDLLTDVLHACSDEERQRLQFSPSGVAMAVQASERYLIMLINNLVQNALHYGRRQVCVSAYPEGGRVWLCVEDDGEGIADEERERVLEPFVRGSALKSDASLRSGYGMGLAIVARIIKWHRAELLIDTSPQLRGARLRVGFERAAG